MQMCADAVAQARSPLHNLQQAARDLRLGVNANKARFSSVYILTEK